MTPFAQGDFLRDQNATPEMLKAKRERLAALMPRYGKADYIGEGIGQLFQGIGSGLSERKMDKYEGEKRQGAQDWWDENLGSRAGGPLSILGMRPQNSGQPLGTNFNPAANEPVSEEEQIGNDALAAIGKEPSGDWLRYANQGATRNQPIAPKLQSALSFLPELGVQMEVVSGGQAPKGSGGPRTGSTRHDHGNAADADFYKDGRKLDWNNPQDLPVLTEIVKRARGNGVTGIGAGDDYMGAGRMHIGFGSDAVWGAGGKGENAPEWLRSAAAGQGVQVAQNGGGQGYSAPGAMASPQGPDMAVLMEAAQNPWLSIEQRQMVNGMIGQQQQSQQAAEDRYWQSQDPLRQAQIAKIQRDLNAQPERKIISGADGYQYYDDGSRVLPGVEATPPEPPSAVREYEYYRAQTIQAGEEPMSYAEYSASQKKAGANNNTVTTTIGGEPTLGADEAELRKKLGGKEGESWNTYIDEGGKSAGVMKDMEMLDEIITMAPQGPITGRLANAFTGFNSAADAFNSIVKRVAPTLRAEGSGSTSDIEYNGMLKSLPQLASRPEANAAISAMMKAKAAINIERSEIVRAYQSEEITVKGARKKLQELDERSIMTPELRTILSGLAPAQGGDDPDAEFLNSLGLE